MDQLNQIIDTTFSSIEKFESFDQYITLQYLYTALDHQLQDWLMGQQESDRMRFIAVKLWDLKLQIHILKRNVHTCLWTWYLVDAALVLGGYNYKIPVCLLVHAFVFEIMSRLIARNY